jgi:hypothetical protein
MPDDRGDLEIVAEILDRTVIERILTHPGP